MRTVSTIDGDERIIHEKFTSINFFSDLQRINALGNDSLGIHCEETVQTTCYRFIKLKGPSSGAHLPRYSMFV